jgi:hypothetical protein
MTRNRFHGVAAATVACLTFGAASAADDMRRSFVSCPIVRDTASVPCWLAENDGELYFLVLQSDVSAPVTPPWLGHKVLVEGTVSDEPRICGGKVLKPVRLSVLPAIDTSCNQILPAEDQYNLTFEPPRPPGPSGGRLAFDGARTPVRTSAPAAADFTAPRDFEIPYTFDGLVGFGHPRYLQAVLDYAQKSKAREIEIVGYRGAAKLTNGETYAEDAAIGKQRAEQVAMLLKAANLSSVDFKVRWMDEASTVTGKDDYMSRRVVVTVRP